MGKNKGRTRGSSTAVVDRLRLANDLTSSLDTHHEEIVEGLDELIGPYLGQEEELQVGSLLRGLRRMIQDHLARLQAADAEQAREVTEDGDLQRRKREVMDEVRNALVDLRVAVNAAYGSHVTEEFLGLQGRTARSVVPLQREGRRVLDRLSRPEESRPEPKPPHQPLDWEAWRKRLEGPVQFLEAVDVHLDLDLLETHDATVQKSEDLARFDRRVGATGRLLSAMYELMEHERARKNVLPKTRKRRNVKRKGKRRPD